MMPENDPIWVKIGVDSIPEGKGNRRPAILNFNVIKDIDDYMAKKEEDYAQKMSAALKAKLKQTGKDSIEELTQEEKEEVADLQGGLDLGIYHFYACLKEGHRIANWDFEIPKVVMKYDEEKGEPVKERVGTRPITPEDVAEWMEEDKHEEAIEKLMGMMDEYKMSDEQEEDMERHQARVMDSEEYNNKDDKKK